MEQQTGALQGLGLGVGPWPNAASPPYVAGERRRSGRLHDTVLVVAKLDGQRYLVSMLGDGSEWVRNVRAARKGLPSSAASHALCSSPKSRERGPILTAYCQVATSGRQHFPVSHNAPLSEFDAVAAERYPVFRIDPA